MPTAPVLEDGRIVFRLPDPDHAYASVRLYQEVQRPRDGLAATFGDGVWTVEMPRPVDAHRLEYAFIVDHRDGGEAFLTDPLNPLAADGPFGAKSVVRLPGYTTPAWLEAPLPQGEGSISWADLPLPRFAVGLPCGIWQPPGATPEDRLPLLIAHDGPEYADLAGLLRLMAVAAATTGIPATATPTDPARAALPRLPPWRIALLAPVPDRRDETYSAAARYADALAFTVLPWLERTAPQPPGSRPVLMGASLGALAALHAAHRHPGRFGGLFLQSGSYFRLRTDGHERDFAHFDRVSRVVGQILATTRASRPLPMTMTCGLVEENLANNRVMADALKAAGHDVRLVDSLDGHTYTAWRDTLDPHLVDLLTRVGVPGAPT
ncbi:hypothetical protein BH23ACT9_BH23ACT9_02410 [soil metagenome]